MEYNFFITHKGVIIFENNINIHVGLKKEIYKICEKNNKFKIINNNGVEIIYLELESLDSIEELTNFLTKQEIEELENKKEYIFFLMLESLINEEMFIVDFISKKYNAINFTKVISNRMLTSSRAFLMNYVENPIVTFFTLRDLIESLKVYLYLLRGEVKEIIIERTYQRAIKHVINENDLKKKIEKIEGKIKMNFKFSKIIKNTPTIKILEEEFKKLDKINRECNDWIHKNGYDKLNTKYLEKIDKKDLKIKMFDVLKVFFLIICFYDPTSLLSNVYFDCTDNGETPPYGSEFWIAPIYQDFIINVYSEKEKNLIKEHCYLDTDFIDN